MQCALLCLVKHRAIRTKMFCKQTKVDKRKIAKEDQIFHVENAEKKLWNKQKRSAPKSATTKRDYKRQQKQKTSVGTISLNASCNSKTNDQKKFYVQSMRFTTEEKTSDQMKVYHLVSHNFSLVLHARYENLLI